MSPRGDPRGEKTVVRALYRDPFLKAVGLIYLAIGAIYLLPGISAQTVEDLAWYLWGQLLLLLTLAAIQYGLRRALPPRGVRFWNAVSVAILLWLAGSSVEAVLPEMRDNLRGALLVDCLYAAYYLVLSFAAEVRPDLGSPPPRGREDELHQGSTVSFILALLVYFSVIPSQQNPEEYLSGQYSVLLYLCLDTVLVVRFAALSSVASTSRWRRAYGLLFSAFAISAVLGGFQFHSMVAPSPLPSYAGTVWDFWWYLPYLALILAARTSYMPQTERTWRESPMPRTWDPLAFYALTFPLLHLLLDFYSQLHAPSRGIQQGLVIIYFVFFGTLALVHSTWRENERRQAEDALRESEKSYRQLIESHPDAILIEQGGKLAYTNSTGIEKFGVDTLGLRSFETLGFPPRQTLDDTVSPWGDLRGGKPVSGIPLECRTAGAGGEAMDLEISYYDTTYRGRPALQAIARDVTEAKRQRDASERMKRLVSLGEFSAAMAHEIRNPLAAIVMHSFFLAEHLSKDNENLRILSDINAAVDRMQKLVNGILGFVRPQELNMVEEDLIAVLDSARLDLGRRGDLPEFAFVEDFRHDLAMVEVDVNQMVAVFANIFDNAARAMPDGGTVTLRTENPSVGGLRIVVEDTGDGIAEEDRERIFEPFFSRREDGVGLGLAFVARILDQHVCRYRVSSKPGRGTRFVLEFPLSSSEDD